MTNNKFDLPNDELQEHSKDSLIRIISYWKKRAEILQDENVELKSQIDELEFEIEELEMEAWNE